jgi:hypothetical protein
MASITDPANTDYNFGYGFDYSVWTAGTQIDLVNVPWNNDYRDVVRFNNKTALDTYIDSLEPAGIRITSVSYVKPNEPVKINIPHNRAIRYNYIRVSNPVQPIPGDDIQKNYYYFILDARYVNPGVTEIVVQLDVWQTYIYDVTIGRCYVERGHIGIANTNNFNNYGRDYLTVPEGLDVGGEYNVVATRENWIMSPTPFATQFRYGGYDILVFSSTDLLADPGTVENPTLVAASGSSFQGTFHGANVYVFDAQSFAAYLSSMKDKPWVTQGIMSITMIPKISRYHPDFVYGAFPLPAAAPTLPPQNHRHNLFSGWRTHADYVNKIPERYRHLNKFKVFPYTAIEMTTFHGSPVVLKPESWNDPNAQIMERVSLVPPSQRVEFMPRYYNTHSAHLNVYEQLWPEPIDQNSYLASLQGDDFGDYLDLVTQIANFPSMAIVNNGAISYLAANTHAIANQYKSADWSQQRALGMAQGQYDVATGAMHTAMSMSGIGVNADIAQTANANRTNVANAIVSAATGVAGGAGGGAVFGGVGAAAGAVGGTVQGVGNLISSGINAAANDESLAVRSRAAAQSAITQNQQQQLVRDTNKGLADWAARGDYAITQGALNAKVQDANLIQPTTAGQTGGETINIVNGGLKVSLRWKLIDNAAIRTIGEFWLRYGYAIRASIVPPANLRVMSKFTYWKMSETYISASAIPEGHKQTVRGVLEKGVTVWTNPADIGVIDWADNAPLGGISY